MIPSRPEPRTAEERASDICDTTDGQMSTYNYVLEQIQQAMDEARAEALEKLVLWFNHNLKESARNEGYLQGFSEGQAAMRERALKVFEEWCPTTYSDNYIYQKLRTRPLSEGMEHDG